MNELVTILWWIKLNDKVNLWNINTSSREISGQKQLVALEFLIKRVFEHSVNLATFFLVNFPMKFVHIC